MIFIDTMTIFWCLNLVIEEQNFFERLFILFFYPTTLDNNLEYKNMIC